MSYDAYRSPQVLTFLAIGGAGYVVDVAVFNLLRSKATLGAWDPSVARVLAVGVAMVVTYLGNSLLTWRGQGAGDRRREVGLFVLFNLVGLGISVLTLTFSHDLLGLTSRTADNISANGVGLALGTLFRYWSYKTFVFGDARDGDPSIRRFGLASLRRYWSIAQRWILTPSGSYGDRRDVVTGHRLPLTSTANALLVTQPRSTTPPSGSQT